MELLQMQATDMIEVFRGFPQSLHVNASLVPWKRLYYFSVLSSSTKMIIFSCHFMLNIWHWYSVV